MKLKRELNKKEAKRVQILVPLLAFLGIVPLFVGGVIPLFLFTLPLLALQIWKIESNVKLTIGIIINSLVSLFVAGVIADTPLHFPVL